MKHKSKKPTRKQREQQGQVPQLFKCAGCGFKGTRFAVKEHREATGHGS